MEAPKVPNWSWNDAFVFHVRYVRPDQVDDFLCSCLWGLEVVVENASVSFLPERIHRG